ncbi:hypothetical protein [Amycolatopsis anabasis]|uniref:hypothetical protein n=1 Tax=Amycolatopsis anabasis TaxID=1840409 RepID=UPI00131D56AA|nr:hypothetical protein [Amycolatopsis anabasis]
MSTPYGGYVLPKRPNGATAIIAGILALGLAFVLGYLPVRYFIDMPSGFGLGDLPGELLTMLGLYLAAAIFLLIGALVTFLRALTGAVLLLIGALLTLAAVLLEPALMYHGDFGTYFQLVFEFELDDASFVRAAGLVFGPITFFLTVLPPTFRYLRFQPSMVPAYGPPPEYPRQQGW